MASQLEIDIYSGRPNPSVELRDDEVAGIERRLLALDERSGVFSPSENLGYRGLRILGKPRSTFQRLEVSAGAVQVLDHAGRRRLLGDPEQQLERWLLETVLERLGPLDRRAVEQARSVIRPGGNEEPR